jgi:hypothetical protein
MNSRLLWENLSHRQIHIFISDQIGRLFKKYVTSRATCSAMNIKCHVNKSGGKKQISPKLLTSDAEKQAIKKF